MNSSFFDPSRKDTAIRRPMGSMEQHVQPRPAAAMALFTAIDFFSTVPRP